MSFTNVEIDGKKATPDRVYYNATVVNNTQSTIQQSDDPTIVFQDARQNPLIPDASSYEVSVQNFTLNGAPKTLPLFIPQICPAILNTIQAGVSAIVSDSNIQESTIDPLKFYKQVKYIFPNSFSVGNNIISCSGFSQSFLNFTEPQPIIACDANSFTIIYYGSDFIADGTYNPVGFVDFTYKDPTDVTTTIYSVTFSCGNTNTATYLSATEPIIWVPENQATYTIVPTTALPTQTESDYYYCYTYTHWIQLVNTALRTAWLAIGGTSLFGTQCPWFEYDPTTGLFNVNQDSKTCMTKVGDKLSYPYNVSYAQAGLYTTGEYSFVGMNTCLESLLTNFNSIYFSYGQAWNGVGNVLLPEVVIDMGLPIDLLIGTTNTNSAVGVALRTEPKTSIFVLANPFDYTPINSAVFVRLTQDFISTGGIWSPIASFVLGTSQVPVRNEASANPISFGAANIGGNTSNSGTFQKVLIETPVDALTADYWKGFIFYEPKTITYSSLDPSHDGITDVDISLYWRNRLTNSLIPVRLPNQGSVSFRLLFKKRLVL